MLDYDWNFVDRWSVIVGLIYGAIWLCLRWNKPKADYGWALADGLTLGPLTLIIADFAGLGKWAGVNMLAEMVRNSKTVLFLACVAMIVAICQRLLPVRNGAPQNHGSSGD